MPEPKFRPSGPRMRATPPVMYSHPCWPTPSTTASAPLFLTAKRSPPRPAIKSWPRSEEHTSELQSRGHLVCRLLLEKKKKKKKYHDQPRNSADRHFSPRYGRRARRLLLLYLLGFLRSGASSRMQILLFLLVMYFLP